MRAALIACLGLLVSLGSSAPASAGLLEVLTDEITLNRRHCDHMPCKRNGLEYQTRYKKGRYLRYEIQSRPVEYKVRRERVRVVPPKVYLREGDGRYHYVDGRWLLVATPNRYSVHEPSQYDYVDRVVLKRPAKHRVVRLKPHTAYYPEKIVVRCQNVDWFGFCY